jgi:alpha-D-ribose 1-methylphosphonate 5-triphosphate synthase subunit PhnH
MSLIVATSLASGFQEPVFDSQRAFRATMESLANPGRLRPIGRELVDAPLPAAAAALILALCDYETPLFLAPSVSARSGVGDYLRFHTDAMLVAEPAVAAFALVDLAHDHLELSAFAQGTPEYPDRSTTVIAIVASLAEGPAMTLSGPGIAGTTVLRISGLPGDFVEQWSNNRATFPLGTDIIFATSDAIVGLPRSTHLIEESR